MPRSKRICVLKQTHFVVSLDNPLGPLNHLVVTFLPKVYTCSALAVPYLFRMLLYDLLFRSEGRLVGSGFHEGSLYGQVGSVAC